MKQDADIVIKYQDVLMNNNDYMSIALEEARLAALENEVPVGCVIVKDNEIIARTHNTRQKNKSAINHAEIMAIDIACKKLNSWQLDGCTLYVTLEPCIMCAGALAWSQIGRIVYGASDPKRGFSTIGGNMLHPKTVVTSGILHQECEALMKNFFAKLR